MAISFHTIAAYIMSVGSMLLPGFDALSADGGEIPEQQIAKFLTAKCVACHHPDDSSGGIDLTQPVVFESETAELWQDVLNQIQRGAMPPEDAGSLGDDERQKFLHLLSTRLDRLAADLGSRDFRFLRLTNQQIAWNWRDLLKIDRDYSRELIQDPPGEHGQSAQSSLAMTGSHLEVYLAALQRAVAEAIPDPDQAPVKYQLHGNDWEKMHYLSRNDLAHGPRRKHKPYRGPKWLEDKFQIPLPPDHFFRIYLHDNRNEGSFRVRVYVRNEPPQEGGQRQPHEMTVFMDKGFKSPMHAVDSFTVEAKPGTQVFEVFGNVLDFPGVDPAPVKKDEDPYGIETHFKYRFITLQNCSPLNSPADQPVNNSEWVIHGDGHFVRADDQWIDAWGEEFGKKNWLKRSHAGAQHHTMGKPSIYKQVMKDTSYVVVERIEFDMPWQWPPASMQPFLDNGRLTDNSMGDGVAAFAQQAWKHPLSADEQSELDALLRTEMESAPSKTEALRNVLATVLADARFLYLTDTQTSAREKNLEQVGWLAAFLWRSAPDIRLLTLADQNEPLSETQLLAEVDRMLSDLRSRRMVSDFTSQWLNFSKLDQTAVNPNYYGWWNPHFKHYMKLESVEFLDLLLREKLSCLNLVSSDFVVVNDMMAKYYGIPKPSSGHRFSKVAAPAERGGVLTQASFLTAHSTGEDAHAVLRGVWLKGHLLGDPPRDPPPAVPALDDLDVPDANKLSTKDRLAAHRTGVCYDCHKDIDPWGVAMEGFDAAGKPRTRILKILDNPPKRLQLPVESSTEISDVAILGMSDLKKLIRENHADRFARSFSQAMLSFALGRPLSYRDDEQIESVTADFRQSDHRMDQLVKSIVLQKLSVKQTAQPSLKKQ